MDRLNELSKGINQELQQNRMLDDLDRDIDEAAEEVNFVMGKLAKLKTKDTCNMRDPRPPFYSPCSDSSRDVYMRGDTAGDVIDAGTAERSASCVASEIW